MGDIFDGGHNTAAVPLRNRKNLLRRAFWFSSPLRFTAHRNENGREYFQEACRKGWEGLIAEDATAGYVSGRSKTWLKFKCVHQQEFVIGGYTNPEGERVGFGALLIGYFDGGDLVYAGKVGTGYDDETLERLGGRIESIERKTTPFDRGETPRNGVHWVTPELVGEVGFTEWTEDGKLRHPRFQGLRRDQNTRDVVRERPAET
jgi:ATP-dependent DNA ligase